jgi:gluconolactonase
MGVYYVSPEGEVRRVLGAADFPRPNGVLVTPDGKYLIVASIEERKIIRYEITAPGELGEGQVLFTGDEELDGGGPDGMALDSEGRIYATYKSVVVLSAEGNLIGRIEVPEKPANCTLGGPEGNILYITARTSLYSVPVNATAPPLMATGPQGTPTTRKVEALDVALQIPTNWEEEAPSSNLRLLQFKVPAVESGADPTEYVVFPPFGGSREENINRWVQQFDPEGRELAMVLGTCAQGEYVQVDLTGTYNKPDGPPVRMQTVDAPGYRMLAVILTTANGNYFIKMVGPSSTMDANVEAFRESFGADATSESEFVLP